jgi:glycosyltransferase involved in cell wall biosynthesis
VPNRAFLDIQAVQGTFHPRRGIARYVTEYSRALLAAAPERVGALALNPMLPPPAGLPYELAHARQVVWNTADTLTKAAESGPILYHVLSPFELTHPVESVVPPHALNGGVPIVCTVYDLIPEALPGLYEPGSDIERMHWIRRDVLKRADLLLAISERTKADAVERLGIDEERVVVVGAGASEYFRPPYVDESPAAMLAVEQPALTKPYVLTVTGWDWRKNTELLIDAWARLPGSVRAERQLVIACTLLPEVRTRWSQRVVERGLEPSEVVLTGFVPDPVLRALYQAAELFVCPSLYEGFGLPVLEAARCGTPAIVSDQSSLPEILDWPAATFTPEVEVLTERLEQGLVDDSFRTGLAVAASAAVERHTWGRVAERALDAYDRIDVAPRSRARRRRVALVGSLHPTSSVGTFNRALAEALTAHVDVDCIVPNLEGPFSGGRAEGARRYPTEAFGRVLSPSAYDAVLYAIADGTEHLDPFWLATRHPGIVWFHDVDLRGMHLAHARSLGVGEGRHFLLGELERYALRTPHQFSDPAVLLDDAAWERAGVKMTARLSTSARGIITGSDTDQHVVELDAGPRTRLPPRWVLPIASSPPRSFSETAVQLLETLSLSTYV